MSLASTLTEVLPIEALLRPIGALFDAASGARGCLFTFHRAAPSALWERLPNRNFYLDLAYLDRLLGYLKAHAWSIVTMEEAIDRARAGRSGDRFANFSVDDCYRDTFEEVVPLFREHGAPVTLFVTTGIPDATMSMWNAGLEDIILRKDRVILDGTTADVSSRLDKRRLYASLEQSWDGPRAGARYSAFCAENGFDETALHEKHAISWAMLETLARDPLVEIGAHTVGHPRVSALAEQEALAELVACRRRLGERLDRDIRHFAFPFGRSGDAGPRDFALARRAGFASAATTRKGVMRRRSDLFSLPRNTLNGGARSLAMAEMHLTGVSGLVARMLGRV
ncbi:polysaccharide deacetylase family protein [Methylosinus sp. H3A]|uniref:polysaccharide deacetylase family protein n=1 Tax=Methylosinus sp. H3A TaxID=2785786 RepID=UPI0018C1FE2A|nr:polysaccharide deacetylase family protein [Methylosinus sp. H3A]MBG0809454.1 polysaccharide deacetylase family protein [Methylosinus sp. H3A]